MKVPHYTMPNSPNRKPSTHSPINRAQTWTELASDHARRRVMRMKALKRHRTTWVCLQRPDAICLPASYSNIAQSLANAVLEVGGQAGSLSQGAMQVSQMGVFHAPHLVWGGGCTMCSLDKTIKLYTTDSDTSRTVRPPPSNITYRALPNSCRKTVA